MAYALSDDSFPGIDDHRRMRWLLHHPDVCAVSFEELIGADGGGSKEAQMTALRLSQNSFETGR